MECDLASGRTLLLALQSIMHHVPAERERCKESPSTVVAVVVGEGELAADKQ